MIRKTLLLAINIFIFSVNVHSQSTLFIKFSKETDSSYIKNFISDNIPDLRSNSVFKMAVKSLPWGQYGSTDDGLDRIVKIITSPDNVNSLFDLFNNQPGIEYVQVAGVYKVDGNVNDSLYTSQWSLRKIKADLAWQISQGSDTVLVGVIDTGVDYLHPDLKNKMFYNPGEVGTDNLGRDKKSNGIDDDWNGFVDDYFGWDFTDRVGFPYDSTGGDYLDWDNDPLDQNIFSHGTAVSGIIGAETNNIIGIAGVAPRVKILNLRAFDPDGFGEEDDVASAILYAVSMGAKVINMSFGDYSFSYILRDVIRYAYSKGVVLVASSGNSNSTLPHYPSAYSEVISVGNSTVEDYVAGSSNYGSTLDLVAPGTSVITTIKNGKYSEFNGTSAAAPFVSAAASLLLSLQNFSNEEVKQIIKSSSDDIGTPGWDLRSGSGRLNVYKALQVLGPAAIKFNSPTQDFTTSYDTLEIYATCLSPYFQSVQLFYGYGANPVQWTSLIDNRLNQFSNELIYSLVTKNMPDTVLTLRLKMTLINSGTLEERINIHVMRNTVEGNIISLFPALYGQSPTIIAAGFTDNPSVMRMFYRKAGNSTYNFITMDGFAINNQFIKDLHFGFIPAGIVKSGTQYEIYFEAEGLNGKVATIQNGNSPFQLTTTNAFELKSYIKYASEATPGVVYKDPIFLSDSSSGSVLIKSPLDNSRTNYLYRFSSNSFNLIDSLIERIPRDFGDFNKNGKKDILSNWGRNTYILEQDSIGSSKFSTKTKYEDSKYWPIFVRDFTHSNRNQLLTIKNDSTLAVYDINQDLSISGEKLIPNFTPVKPLDEYTFVAYQTKSFEFPSGEMTDLDNDGKNELWMADADGDILCYNISSDGMFSPDTVRSFRTGFFSSSNYITSGDFNGDDKLDLAVLLHSIEEVDIADYNRLLILTFNNNKPEILYDQAFLDPATEFSVFTKRTYNSLRFVNLDTEQGEELVVAMFPYAYVLKYQNNTGKVIFFDENVNSNAVFSFRPGPAGTLNTFGISTSSEFRILEFDVLNRINTPVITDYYSYDSSSVNLTWESLYNQFYIFRGNSRDFLTPIGLTSDHSYRDTTVLPGQDYFYYITAVDPLDPSVWAKSDIIKVFHHPPSEMKGITVNSRNSVSVQFSDKMSNVITDLRSIFAIDSNNLIIYPNSVASLTQYSYLVTFKDNLADGAYKLTLSGLRDLYKSFVKKDTLNFSVASLPAQSEFYISSFEIRDPYTVEIRFNLNADPVSAQSTVNYEVLPGNSVSSAVIKTNDSSTVILSLNGGKPVGAVGQEYTLNIKNVFSSLASGYVRINAGAGSSIVLASNKNNLSEVFVYPSPVKLGNTPDRRLTFANLTRFAKISIWNLAGDKITDLEEKDGNGGVSWNLIDSSGKEITSGIYLYRIVMLNSSGEEIENKIGKFAVVK